MNNTYYNTSGRNWVHYDRALMLLLLMTILGFHGGHARNYYDRHYWIDLNE